MSIFQSSEEVETKESLALLAASSIGAGDPAGGGGDGQGGYEGLEKYTQSLSSVESLLTFDRLKQEVAILEAMKRKGLSLTQQAQELPVFLVTFSISNKNLQFFMTFDEFDQNIIFTVTFNCSVQFYH